VRHLLFVLGLVAATAQLAHAQVQQPISPYVIDLRGFYSGLGQDLTTAANLGVPAINLPKRGLGGVLGLHVYPLRTKVFALGLGGEFLLARGRAQEKDATTGDPVGLPIEQRVVSLSPQISLNFGHRGGWSYLTAGMGPLSFETFEGTIAPADAPPKKNTINMGGGARWFATSHVAFMFDVRYYLTRPEEVIGPFPGRARNRLRILSAGIAIR
jgi:hypothetical protein